MFSRTEERLAILLILTGLALRAWLFVARGEAYEVDQAMILYWGRDHWRNGTLAVFGPEFTRWEMLASYLYGGLDLLGVDPRAGVLALSTLEIALTGAVACRLWSRGAGLVAMAFLAVLPWHVFYSSIVGTCVAVGIWPLVLLLGNAGGAGDGRLTGGRLAGDVALRALGLWHYSAFRVYLAAEFLWAAARRRARPAALAVGGFAVFLAATLALEPESWRQAFFRGEYVFGTPDYRWWEAVPRGLLFLLTPMKYLAREISDMEVGTALVDLLGPFALPLGGPGTLLAGLGVRALLSRDGAVTGPSREAERFLLFFGAFALVTVSFAASFTHLLFLVPVLVLAMARGCAALGPRWRGPALFVVGVWCAVDSARLASSYSVPDPRDLFSRRIATEARLLNAEGPTSGEPAPAPMKFLLSSQGMIEARYWMDRLGGFRVLPPQTPAALETLTATIAGPHAEIWVLIDRFVDPVRDPARFPGLAEQNRRIEDFILHIKRRAQVIEERPIEDGVARAVLFKIRWP